ncbi:SGNH/GDSL hydrolase family protein [Lacisediminihabitans changchengi]|uniref:SGNH/GDSL hydrolase family protein n=1 Tax=Lacisediminihabitans changchengi TaxID=2787634 RepID=A0A934VYW0_9MICO|nr:SGNH/GDSL hydrolase family protein [Lacisediminihabitans changchengi]MBK4348467.1 SGNH/GDSL hydrolase family protein [Lacisediminihabitans changchengi]
MRLAVILLSSAAAATAATLAGRMLVLRRQRTGAAKLAATLHLNARWWKQQRALPGEIVYVALGDSAAQGVGASRPGRSYVGMLADHLRRRTGRTVRVANLSVSGARLREAIAVQLPLLTRFQPDLVTAAIGANDIASFEPGRFERELAVVYDALPPGSIVGDIPAFYFGSAERRVRAANEIVHRLAADRGFEVAPVHALTRRQGGARYALNQVAADFFHPNDRGYRVWASAFIPLLDRRFPRARSTAAQN